MSYTLKISQDDNDRRLDRTLRSLFKWVTLGEIMKSIRVGEVRVNGKRIRDCSTHIYAGDELTVKWPLERQEKSFSRKSWGDIKIIFQGQNVLILNKPSGILVQPDEKDGDSVITRVWSMNENSRAAAVHRLDRNTTGVLAVALNGEALRALEKLFKERKITKNYLAIVKGKAPEKKLIDAPLLKDSENNLVRVSPKGLTALTNCERLGTDKNGEFSLVKLELLTGRTHQARVHMSHIKHPIVGDKKYGDYELNKSIKNIKRPLLHAYTLSFPEDVAPCLNEIAGAEFKAQIPDDIQDFIEERGLRINDKN